MWKVYLKSNEGIAIQSREGGLHDCLRASGKEILVESVKYIDYETDSLPDAGLLTPFLHKRKSFEHERELRALFADNSALTEIVTKDRKSRPGGISFASGLPIPVDLDRLIERVFVAPTAPGWFQELVKSVLEKYDLKNKEVIKSSINTDPVW